MLELQDVFKKFGQQFIDTNNVHISGLKSINPIIKCRTQELGGHIDVCDSCGSFEVRYNSCRNRNCPKCGNLKKE